MMDAAAATLTDDPPMGEGERRCLASGEVRPRESMLRFVVAPDPALGVVPDLAGTLPGRGLWVTSTRAALESAIARNAFARAARAPVRVDPGLAERVEAALARRIIDWLGLARRAGAATPGFEKTHAALSRGKLELIVEAHDASRGGSERLASRAIERITVLSRAELGWAFGRDELVHVGILDATWAARLKTEAARLAGFRRPAAHERT
jgi:hypothetical protein